MLTYRPDIDGLRALSVVLVILFHAGMAQIGGGFIGVDVFFVISGYLITSIILRELESGTFSLLSFYERRVRRIFPALMLVLALSLIAGWFLMMPQEFESFGKNLAGTAVFSSNILFWRAAGYFDLGSGFKPLLHTWSVAVEEQYYIVFPLYMIVVFRWFRKWAFGLTIAGLIVSFLLSIGTMAIGKDIATFYLLPTRAWELLAGAVLAFGVLPPVTRDSHRHVLSVLGLACILGAALVYKSSTPFPGLYALLPVLGAALVIYAAGGVGARLLAARPVVFVGKISYSLYLWHWPLLIFFEYYLMRDLYIGEKLALIALCFGLAVLSWRYVEQPFRRKAVLPRRLPLFVAGGVALLVFLGGGLAIYLYKGVPQRFSPAVQALAVVEKGPGTPAAHLPGFRAVNRYLGAYQTAAPDFLVWGDSHANALAPALDTLGREDGKSGYLVKQAGCMPAFDLTASDLGPECYALNRAVKAFLEGVDGHAIKTVFLIARWSAYPRWLSPVGGARGTAESRTYVEGLLAQTIAALKARGVTVYIVAEAPKVCGYAVPSVLGRSLYYKGQAVDIRPDEKSYLDSQSHLHAMFRDLEKAQGVTTLYPHKLLCDGEKCAITKAGKTLYYDDDHLSSYGARQLTALFAGCI